MLFCSTGSDSWSRRKEDITLQYAGEAVVAVQLSKKCRPQRPARHPALGRPQGPQRQDCIGFKQFLVTFACVSAQHVLCTASIMKHCCLSAQTCRTLWHSPYGLAHPHKLMQPLPQSFPGLSLLHCHLQSLLVVPQTAPPTATSTRLQWPAQRQTLQEGQRTASRTR